MGHIALYREWRPKTFDEIVEQTHTVAALRQAVLSGKIAHAYLFSGTRGTGKTTMAQVFSRAINCLAPENGNPCNKCPVCTGILNGSVLDVIEMDAASNNSVDTIRRLCDEIVFTPSVAKYKVYIIDEVHMLSTGAFNALLKTLEEPPSHAVFILATTEQHRIPATILSRCQRYEFRRIPVASIAARLRKIADADGVSIRDDALKAIAQLSDGALRDAISLMDQAKGSFQGPIGKEDILSLVGVVNDEFMNQMALAIVRKDPDHAMRLIEEFILDGRDVIRFTIDLAGYFRNVMICKVTKNPEELVYAPTKTIAEMGRIASILPLDSTLDIIRQLSALISDLRWSPNPRTTFEIAVIRLMDSSPKKSVLDQPEDTGKKPEDTGKKPEDTGKKPETIPAAVEPEAFIPAIAEPESVTPAIIEPEAFTPAIAEPEAFTPTIAEPIPAVSVAILPEPVISAPDKTFTTDIEAVWPEILDNIISLGQMTVYLFLLPGKPVLEQGTLRILFDDSDRMNCAELSDPHNLQIISQAVHQATGTSFTVSPALQSDEPDHSSGTLGMAGSEQNGQAAPAPESSSGGTVSSGFDSLRKSAQELGISFYMEE